MNDLLEVIAELGLELHPDRIAVVASKIQKIGSVEQFALVKNSFGPNTEKKLIHRFKEAWSKHKTMAPCEIASALRGASTTASLQEIRGAIELVWSGPSTGKVPVRHTEQVLCEVINSAKRKLFLVSFVAYRVDSIVNALRNAIGRQVEISLLLETSLDNGGRVKNHDSIQTMKSLLPSLNIYIWSPENNTSGLYPGAVHAKCAVADGDKAFITSANFTTAAMEWNMELGVLVSGGELPVELHRHLELLITQSIIVKV